MSLSHTSSWHHAMGALVRRGLRPRGVSACVNCGERHWKESWELGRRHGAAAAAGRWLSSAESARERVITESRKPRVSPYSVFGLPKHASEAQIKQRFREMVKAAHPDAKGSAVGGEEGDSGHTIDSIMGAYRDLLSNTGAGLAQDNRVAARVEDCDVSVEELYDDPSYTVVPIKVRVDELLSHEEPNLDQATVHQPHEAPAVTAGAAVAHTPDGAPMFVPEEGLEIYVTSNDSIADVKRDLMAQFGAGWGLEGRRLDIEGLPIGWELVHHETVLCPNFFVATYGMESGDTLHVVVRNYGKDAEGV